ncbi:hypothetical protein D3C83_73900 [compost metagenome]
MADADPISRFTIAVTRMMPPIVTCPGSPSVCRKVAPLRATSAPRFERPKASVKRAAKNAMTM